MSTQRKSEPQTEENAVDSGVRAPIDPRAPGVLARSTYQELRQGGLTDTDIMAFAGELLSLVACGVREQTAAE